MNTGKRVLFLHAGRSGQDQLEALAMVLTQLGSSVALENLGSGKYDHVLSAVALADTVVYWPGGSAD